MHKKFIKYIFVNVNKCKKNHVFKNSKQKNKLTV